jgi:hypothetical protein
MFTFPFTSCHDHFYVQTAMKLDMNMNTNIEMDMDTNTHIHLYRVLNMAWSSHFLKDSDVGYW